MHREEGHWWEDFNIHARPVANALIVQIDGNKLHNAEQTKSEGLFFFNYAYCWKLSTQSRRSHGLCVKRATSGQQASLLQPPH